MRLGRELAVGALRHSQQFDPFMVSRIASDNLVGLISRAVANDNPTPRQDGLGDDRSDRILDERAFIPRWSYKNVGQGWRAGHGGNMAGGSLDSGDGTHDASWDSD